MLILFLCLCVVAGSTYIGYSFSYYYKKRKNFFEDFIDFLNHAKTQISCFQTRLYSIFCSFNAHNLDLEKVIKTLAYNLEKNDKKEVKKPGYIFDDEWEFVFCSLSSLGKTDTACELEHIEAIKTKAITIFNNASDEYKQKNSLCIKLGIAFGIFISIIII